MPLMLTIQTQMLFESYYEYPFHVSVYRFDLVHGSGQVTSFDFGIQYWLSSY